MHSLFLVCSSSIVAMFMHTCEVLTSDCILELSVLEPCGPLGVGGDLPVFPGGIVTVVGVVGVPLPPRVVGVNITALSVVCLVHIQTYEHAQYVTQYCNTAYLLL